MRPGYSHPRGAPGEYAGLHGPQAPEPLEKGGDALHKWGLRLIHWLQLDPQTFSELSQGRLALPGRISFERSPCLRAFKLTAVHRSGVLDPVLLRALRPLASAFLALVGCPSFRL
jgi:hypothetical protein